MQQDSDRPQRHIQLLKAAIELREAQEYEQALTLLEKSIQSAPNYPLTYVFLGLTHQELGRNKEAEKAFRKALAIDPQCSEALLGLGMLLLSQNQLPEAIIYLQKHLDLNPNNPDTLDVLVPTLLKVGRVQDADKVLIKAWIESKDEDIAVRYARFLLSTDQLDKADSFLRQAIETTESPPLLLELALTLVIKGKYTEAIPILQRALRRRPDYDRALRGLSHCFAQIKQAENALEYAVQALAINPRHYRNWQVKADALLLLERFEDAIEAAQTGIDLIESGDDEALPVLGVLYVQKLNALLRLNRIDEALSEMVLARQQMPDDPRFYLYPIQVLAQVGRLSEGLLLAKEATQKGILKDNQELMKVLHTVAEGAVKCYISGQISVASQAFHDLAILAPNEPRFLMALGFIQTGQGDLEGANISLQDALARSDEDSRGIILCDLGYLHIIQGRYDEAERELAEALETEDKEALLRIAYLKDGNLIPDYTPHPTRWVSIHTASKANLAALALLRGQINRAVELAEAIIASAPQRSLGYEVLGCAQYAGGQLQEALKSWQQAAQLAEDERLRALLGLWISAQ